MCTPAQILSPPPFYLHRTENTQSKSDTCAQAPFSAFVPSARYDDGSKACHLMSVPPSSPNKSTSCVLLAGLDRAEGTTGALSATALATRPTGEGAPTALLGATCGGLPSVLDSPARLIPPVGAVGREGEVILPPVLLLAFHVANFCDCDHVVASGARMFPPKLPLRGNTWTGLLELSGLLSEYGDVYPCTEFDNRPGSIGFCGFHGSSWPGLPGAGVVAAKWAGFLAIGGGVRPWNGLWDADVAER
jgi:hypothetical protein